MMFISIDEHFLPTRSSYKQAHCIVPLFAMQRLRVMYHSMVYYYSYHNYNYYYYYYITSQHY
jgi:hypothetical protein